MALRCVCRMNDQVAMALDNKRNHVGRVRKHEVVSQFDQVHDIQRCKRAASKFEFRRRNAGPTIDCADLLMVVGTSIWVMCAADSCRMRVVV